VLYVDFTDAFGSVDHARLHCIMESMGIPGDAIAVINKGPLPRGEHRS
jgi:hypothetical protein